MPQHRVAELERVLELGERLVVALDVHEDVVRLVDLGDRVGQLPATPVLEAVHGALAARDHALVALDHLRHLLALVGMNDENDFVMAHVLVGSFSYGFSRSPCGVTRPGRGRSIPAKTTAKRRRYPAPASPAPASARPCAPPGGSCLPSSPGCAPRSAALRGCRRRSL